MRGIPNIIRVGAIVCIAWFAAAALTPITSVSMRNSTIDSTNIGGTTPSSGRFTTIQSTSNFGGTVPGGQGAYTQWNTQAAGETNFVNQRGTGAGGFSWFNAANTGAIGSPVMTLDGNGNLSTLGALNGTSAMFQTLMANSDLYSSSSPQGSYTAWDIAGDGDMDFIDSHVTASGGFRWYNATTGSALPTAVMFIDNFGRLNVPNGVVGNSNTASAFDHTPTVCPAGQAATGVTSTGGAASCGYIPHNGNGSSCTTGSAAFSTCPSIVTWVPAFADNGYRMSCTIVGASDPRAAIVDITAKTATTATVRMATEGAVSITFAGLDCIAQHN